MSMDTARAPMPIESPAVNRFDRPSWLICLWAVSALAVLGLLDACASEGAGDDPAMPGDAAVARDAAEQPDARASSDAGIPQDAGTSADGGVADTGDAPA